MRQEEAMKYGLIIRGPSPEGDDERQRHREDLEAARRTEELGYETDPSPRVRAPARLRFPWHFSRFAPWRR